MYWIADLTPDGALWREKFEADDRDYRVDQILKKPTPTQIKKLPKKVDLTERLKKTYIQSPYNSCTAAALTHLHVIQNIFDFNDSEIDMDWKDLRTNMGHDLNNSKEWWDYLEHALKTLNKKWLAWTDPNWRDIKFKLDSYAYHSSDDNNLIKYFISKGHPLYCAFLGTKQVYREMKKGRLTTVITRWEHTGWHCLAITGYDEDDIIITNSWTPVKWLKSTFRMSWEQFNKAKASWMFNWRYWIVYDRKDVDSSLFLDYSPDITSEEYDAVKFMKDKWFMKWYKNKFMPNKILTREEFSLVMYRMFWKEDSPVPSKKSKTT